MMRQIEKDILEVSSKLEDGFTSRDMKEFMSARGYPIDTNTVPATLNELHSAGFLFFLKKKEGRFFRYYHSKYRNKFSPKDRHDTPLSKDSWEELAEELAKALYLSVKGAFPEAKAQTLLERFKALKEEQSV